MRLRMTLASGGRLSLVVLLVAAVLLAGCEDVVKECPPLAHPPVLTVAAASNPCQAKAGEAAKLLELRVVMTFERTQQPHAGRYPMRCGTKKYAYLHLLDEMAQGNQDHCDPVNDAACQDQIAYTLEHGGVAQPSNLRFSVEYNEAQSACHDSKWGFQVVMAPNPPAGPPGWKPDGLPVGLISAFYLSERPKYFP